MLSQDDIRFYREQGYLKVEGAVTPDQLARLQAATHALIDQSRHVSVSDARFDLDEGHTADNPRLTRIKLPHKHDPFYWDVLTNSRITEVLTQLLGSDTVLQNTKLNTKAPGGGQAVEWHQDWAYYPHTNDDMLAFGLMLEDVTPENGPLQVIPGSHRGPVLSHFNPDGYFCGAVDPDDPAFHLDRAVTLTGKAGDMTVHHVRTLHGSAPNRSDRARMILFYECRAADAWPLVGSSHFSKIAPKTGESGLAAIWAHMADNLITGELTTIPRTEVLPSRLPLPPAPDSGSLFKTQKSGGAKSAFSES